MARSDSTACNRRTFVVSAAATATLAAGVAAPAVAEEAPVADGRLVGYLDSSADWLGAAPVIPEDQSIDTVEVDVVVCGGGHAGTGVAMRANDCGATVAVIEKATQDMHTYIGGELGNFNSKFLESRGFGGYDLGQITREFCIRAGGRCNQALISKYVDNSGPCLDAILESIPADDEILSEERLTVHVSYDHLTGADYPIYSGGYYTWAGDTQFWGLYNDQLVAGVASFSTTPAVSRPRGAAPGDPATGGAVMVRPAKSPQSIKPANGLQRKRAASMKGSPQFCLLGVSTSP